MVPKETLASKDAKYIRDKVMKRTVKLVTGRVEEVNTSEIVGFCHVNLHKGYLTRKLLKEHDCIAKHCKCLEKFPDYPFWKKRDKSKKAKRDGKAAKRIAQSQISLIHRQAQVFADNQDMNIIITGVVNTGTDSRPMYIIQYVSSARTNDWYCYTPILNKLKKVYKYKFMLKHVKLPNGKYATIQDWNATAYLRK